MQSTSAPSESFNLRLPSGHRPAHQAPSWQPSLLHRPLHNPSPPSSALRHHQTNRITTHVTEYHREETPLSPRAQNASNIGCPLISSPTVTRRDLRMGTAGCLCRPGCSIMHRMGHRGIGEQSVWELSMDQEARQTLRVRLAIMIRIGQSRRLTENCVDTSHVPCKFFRTGQCQAGKACPFSHSTDISTVDTPCKYFAKVRSTVLALTRCFASKTY